MADINVGSVSVKITPDARGFDAKAEAALSGQVAELGRRLGLILSENLKAALTDAHIDVDIDTTAATAQLAELTAEIEAVPDIHVNADVDQGGKGLRSLGGLATAAGDGILSLASSFGPLVIGAGILYAALVPLIAVIGGLTIALAAPLGAAGLGTGLFAFLAGKFIKDTEKVSKQIDTLRKKASTLSDPKAKAAALAQAKDLEDSLTRPQQAFLDAKDKLSGAFNKLTSGKAGDALIKPIAAGMTLLANILPKVEPLIVSVSDALTGLVSSLADKAKGPGFTSFIATLAQLAGPAITTAASILGSLARSLNAVLVAGTGTGVAALNGIAGAFQRLATYLNSTTGQAKLQSFFAWVQTNAPTVLGAIGAIVKLFLQWSVAITPIGLKLIGVVGAISRLASRFGTFIPPILAIIAGFHKLGSAVSSAASAVGSGMSRMVSAVSSGVSRVVSKVTGIGGKIKSALDSLPSQLYKLGQYAIQGFINGITSLAKSVAGAAIGVAKNAVDGVKGFLHIGSPSKLFHQFGQWTMEGFINGITAKSKAVTGSLQEVVRDLARTFKNHDISKSMADEMNKVVGSVKKGLAAVNTLISDAKSYAGTVAGNFLNNPFNLGDPTTGLTGLDALRQQLATDTTNAKAMTAALKAAISKGLSGGLLKQLAASGDVGTTQQIAGLSRSGIAQLEAQFNARDKASIGAGGVASGAIYGAKIAALLAKYDHTLDKLDQKLYDATFKGTRDGLKSGASSGQHASKNRPK